MKPRACLLPVEELTPGQRDQMFNLMDGYYRNVNRARFETDLAEKSWVILVLDPSAREVRGFSTQMLIPAEVAGRMVVALFSGDTIVDRRHWGDHALAHIWGQFALSLIDAQPQAELYWYLISKGYKTYRFLPVFFHEFYPRPDVPTPGWARAVLDSLGRRKFADVYDPIRGVIDAHGEKDCLRDTVAPITAERLRDPYVRFFVKRNPWHIRGDELCCLAPLTRANFTPAAYRVIGPESIPPPLSPSMALIGPEVETE